MGQEDSGSSLCVRRSGGGQGSGGGVVLRSAVASSGAVGIVSAGQVICPVRLKFSTRQISKILKNGIKKILRFYLEEVKLEGVGVKSTVK